MRTHHVAIIGAGIGGLATALLLAARGLEVTVFERGAHPGGKIRQAVLGPERIDAGPTVFTMRWVFEELLAEAGASLDDVLTLQPAEILARHAWNDRDRLDLFADADRTEDAIGRFAGAAEARGYRRFRERSRTIYRTLERSFIRSSKPSPVSLVRDAGLGGAGDLWRISPFTPLWRALGTYFHDPRLRQLFGRYATYCGSSPFLAPATLMLVAHVEQEGVWLVDGGMNRIAEVLTGLAAERGATFRYETEAEEVIITGGRAVGIRLSTDERIEADAVVVNADVAAIARGRLGTALARAVTVVPVRQRSLSAMTWAMVANTEGFPLSRHTVFFSEDYRAEFDDLFGSARPPVRPTVYVCAQDRDATQGAAATGPERIFCLINAPPIGDAHSFGSSEIKQCEDRVFGLMERCGLAIRRRPESTVVTTPTEFEHLFPGTGGALYGQVSHGWTASFRRPPARTRIPGVYLAGGSTHPGPGVPMAALSGRQAATSLLTDLASTRPSRPTAMPGGTSTR